MQKQSRFLCGSVYVNHNQSEHNPETLEISTVPHMPVRQSKPRRASDSGIRQSWRRTAPFLQLVPPLSRWPRHATSDGLLLPRVPRPLRLWPDPGGRAGPRRHQLHAGRGRSRREDQHDSQLHLQRVPGRVPADGLRRLQR